MTQRLFTPLLTLGLLWLSLPAFAQPVNDDRADATVVPGLPFTESYSTVDATSEPDDPDCSGTGATVWYTFTPSAGGFVAANTFGSDYDTTLSVYTDDGSLTQIACNDDFNDLQSFVVWEVTAGTPYLIMVGSYGSGPGGNLTITVEEGLPPLVIDVGLDAKSSVRAKTGVATITGTVLCNEPATVYGIGGQLEQRRGRNLLVAYWYMPEAFECTPPSTPWQATAGGDTTFFTGGKAVVRFVSAYACGEQTCDDVWIEGPIPVHLTGKK
jgi:hypothetical protein